MSDLYVAGKEEQKKIDDLELDLPAQKGRFSSVNVFPSGVRFETQEEGENIVLLLRMHWVTNIPWIFLSIIFLLVPLVLSSFPIISFLPWRFQIMSLIIWYLLVTAFIFERFLVWFFNVYIITDQRIVDVDFYNLLYKEVSDAQLEKIQDVTYKMGGVVRILFDFGDVFIQTAGTEPNFDFLAVANPSRVVSVLEKLRERKKGKGVP